MSAKEHREAFKHLHAATFPSDAALDAMSKDQVEAFLDEQGIDISELKKRAAARKQELLARHGRVLAQMLARQSAIAARVAPETSEVVDWGRFPVREMARRGWIAATTRTLQQHAEELLREFFAPLEGGIGIRAMYRRTRQVRAKKSVDSYALLAWAARVAMKSAERPPTKPYRPGAITLDVMRQVARLSAAKNGPQLAVEFLMDHGVSIVIEPHLEHTRLDGAAILLEAQPPVVGLTLRHDRLDNFWFSLMHELAHLALHSKSRTGEFFDDFEDDRPDDPIEKEADQLAGEALIATEEWKRSAASKLRSADAAKSLARKLQIHPAIVAGRIHWEFGSYRVLQDMVGRGEVRKHFPAVTWP